MKKGQLVHMRSKIAKIQGAIDWGILAYTKGIPINQPIKRETSWLITQKNVVIYPF
jgi:hypothetical protein